jgi:hypothetical protein
VLLPAGGNLQRAERRTDLQGAFNEMVEADTQIEFAVYLLHAAVDEGWVEERLAKRLEDEEGLHPHFYKWNGIPGNSRQENMQYGFNSSPCCAVCLGTNGLGGFEQMMQQAATRRKSNNSEYRLIPVLLPGSDPDSRPELLLDLTYIDFRNDDNFEYEFYRFVCGIRNKPPGPWSPNAKHSGAPKGGNIPGADTEKYEAAFQRIVKIIAAGVKEGLSEKEAAEFRKTAFKDIVKKATRDFNLDQVGIQDNRTDRP